MSTINNGITIDWGGSSYYCLLTFGVIDRIEQDFNIVELDLEIAQGVVDCEKVAILFTHILNSSGANVNVDDVGKGMFKSGNSKEKHLKTIDIVKKILRIIFPERPKKKLKKDEPSEALTSYPWGEFYKRMVGIEGIQPSEFWKMTPAEAFLIIDLKEPEEKIGAFTVDEFEQLAQRYEELNG